LCMFFFAALVCNLYHVSLPGYDSSRILELKWNSWPPQTAWVAYMGWIYEFSWNVFRWKFPWSFLLPFSMKPPWKSVDFHGMRMDTPWNVMWSSTDFHGRFRSRFVHWSTSYTVRENGRRAGGVQNSTLSYGCIEIVFLYSLGTRAVWSKVPYESACWWCDRKEPTHASPNVGGMMSTTSSWILPGTELKQFSCIKTVCAESTTTSS